VSFYYSYLIHSLTIRQIKAVGSYFRGALKAHARVIVVETYKLGKMNRDDAAIAAANLIQEGAFLHVFLHPNGAKVRPPFTIDIHIY
jgi:hypothetical protein